LGCSSYGSGEVIVTGILSRLTTVFDVEKVYRKTDRDKLNSAIKDITIHLKSRGESTGTSRRCIQKTIAYNIQKGVVKQGGCDTRI